MKQTQIWVHPKFKQKIKQKAIDRGIPVVKLTEIIAKDDDPFEDMFLISKTRRKKTLDFTF